MKGNGNYKQIALSFVLAMTYTTPKSVIFRFTMSSVRVFRVREKCIENFVTSDASRYKIPKKGISLEVTLGQLRHKKIPYSKTVRDYKIDFAQNKKIIHAFLLFLR